MNTRAEAWDAECIDLAADALRRAGVLRLRLRGVSMLPTLWPGDEVEIASCSASGLQRGEVVLACRDGRFFLHRVLDLPEADTVVTRGDAMPGSDPVFSGSAILGKLVHVVRGGRTMAAPLRLASWRRALGLLFCYSAVSRSVALRLYAGRAGRKMAEPVGNPEATDLTCAL